MCTYKSIFLNWKMYLSINTSYTFVPNYIQKIYKYFTCLQVLDIHMLVIIHECYKKLSDVSIFQKLNLFCDL